MQLRFVDITRLLMSLLIVSGHVWLVVQSNYAGDTPWLAEFLDRYPVRVAFFFALSGFLMGRKINASDGAEMRYNAAMRTCRYAFRLFAVWTLLYIPIAIADFVLSDLSLGQYITNYVSNLITAGEPAYAWPLWYLYSMGISAAVIAFTLKKRWPLLPIFILFLLLSRYGGSATTAYVHDERVAYVLHTVLKRPLFGVAVMLAGIYLSRYERIIMRYGWCVGVPILILLMPIMYEQHYPLLMQIGGIAVFLTAASIPMPGCGIYTEIRACSKYVYFTHMYFIFAAIALQNLGIVNWQLYQLLPLAITAVLLLSIALTALRHHFAILNRLI